MAINDNYDYNCDHQFGDGHLGYIYLDMSGPLGDLPTK